MADDVTQLTADVANLDSDIDSVFSAISDDLKGLSDQIAALQAANGLVNLVGVSNAVAALDAKVKAFKAALPVVTDPGVPVVTPPADEAPPAAPAA